MIRARQRHPHSIAAFIAANINCCLYTRLKADIGRASRATWRQWRRVSQGGSETAEHVRSMFDSPLQSRQSRVYSRARALTAPLSARADEAADRGLPYTIR
jgi:hypothetical protein